MFSLIYGFYEYMFQKPSYKILIIGVDNAGKTVLLLSLNPIDYFGTNKDHE